MRRLVSMLAVLLVTATVSPVLAAKSNKGPAPAALQGYCPVAYVTMGHAMKGDPRFTSTHHGQRYQFANADAKKMFDAEPAKYDVAYNGWCTTAMSMGKKMKSDPTLVSVHEGKAYLFSSADAKKAFEDMPGAVIEKADQQWSAVSK